MAESYTKTFPELKLLNFNGNVVNTLFLTLSCTFLVWYVQYHWSRRKLYQMAAARKGPRTLPFIGNALHFLGYPKDVLNNIIRVTSKYESPVPFWVGQKLMFGVWTPKDLEVIMNSPHALAKNEWYRYAQVVCGTGLFTAPVPKWKRHRRVILPTFNQKSLDQFVDIFAAKSQILLTKLEAEVGKGVFDVYQHVSRCTLDIICETAMGISVNAQTTESDYVQWSAKSLEIVFARMFGVLYRIDFLFNQTATARELAEYTKKMYQFTASVVTEKKKAYQEKLRQLREHPEDTFLEDTAQRKTFLQLLLELSEEGEKFTDEELREEVDTFMIAGSETTASMNSFIFMILGMYPEIQDRVHEEIIDVVGAERSIESKDLGRLRYLERVIKESMRLFPVGPFVARAVTGDIPLESCTIPEGCSVVLVIMTLHRDPKIWPNPLKFDPDRFLPEEVSKRHPYSWLPFSGGPRNCVGTRYAMMAMKTLIATAVRKYRFFSDYKCVEDIKVRSDLVLKPEDGYKVYIENRE